MIKKQTHSTTISGYDEAAALQDLLIAINEALFADEERYKANDDTAGCDEFTININGKSIAFYLGGPQCSALHSFVEHIADENFYAVDIQQGTVEGW